MLKLKIAQHWLPKILSRTLEEQSVMDGENQSGVIQEWWDAEESVGMVILENNRNKYKRRP